MKRATCKKLQSLIISIVMFVSCYGIALADTLTLPSRLITIESEAFSGTTSLDTVVIPWGTERIESRAFAGSSAKAVYIPGSVYYIADDAFDGASVTIHASEGSYAASYAEEHNIAYNSDAEDDSEKALDDLHAMISAGDTLPSLIEDDLRLETLSTSIFEYDDPVLDDLKTEVKALNEAITAYNADIDEIERLTAEIQSLVSSFSIDGDPARASMFGCSLQVDEGVSFSSISNVSMSGENAILTSSDGSVYTLIASGNAVHIVNGAVYSSEAMSSGGTTRARAPSKDNQGGNFFDTVSTIASDISYILDGIKYANSGAQRKIDEINKEIARIEKSIEKSKKNDIGTDRIYVEEGYIKEYKGEIEKIKPNAEAKYSKLRKLGKATAYLNSLSTVQALLKIIDRGNRITEIYGHTHPTQNDKTPTAIDISDEMRDKIRQLWILYATETTVLVIGLGVELSSLAGTPAATYVADLLLSAAISAMEILMDNLYDDVIRDDDLLHTYIYGYITDEDTKEPLEGVIVYTDENNFTTDKLGYYEIYLPYDEAVSVMYSKESYRKDGKVITLVPGSSIRQDIELKQASGTITVTVTNEGTGAPLAGATVTCGEDTAETDYLGMCTFNVEEGDWEVKATKQGYISSDTVTVSIADRASEPVQISLKKGSEIWNREDLEGIADDPNSNYVLCADIYLQDAEWTPLPWFGGILDGGGHSINGMTINGGDSVGLFLGLYGGTVFNLSIYSADINVTADANYTNIGVLGGGLNNGSKVENCGVQGNIHVKSSSGNVYTGGLTGFIGDADLSDCFVDVAITAETNNTTYVGGIAGGSSNIQMTNCDYWSDITVKQTGSNSGVAYNVYGTTYVNGSLADRSDARGTIILETNDAGGNVYGIARGTNSHNLSNITASTKTGTINVYGCFDCENSYNDGEVKGSATGSGTANVFGANGKNMTNDGAVTAEATSGKAWATGVQGDGKNTGNIYAKAGSGNAQANGVSGNGGAGSSNSGSVTAVSSSSTLAVGMSNCKDSENTGDVTATTGTGNAVGQGMSNCTNSTNRGKVTVTYKGSTNGGLSAQGLNNCTDSENYGDVSGSVTASTTACTVTGASGGSRNKNYGRVDARSSTGPANARGIYCSYSQNYGTIFAQSTCSTVSSISNATAYGIGPNFTGCTNEGTVSAISKSSVAYAYGYGDGCSNTTSTGNVSATSQYFVVRQIENGYEGELGRAYAKNSAFVTATVASCTASAAGNETYNMYFFIASSSCEKHKGLAREFVVYNEATQPNLDSCFVPCGYAIAVSP